MQAAPGVLLGFGSAVFGLINLNNTRKPVNFSKSMNSKMS